MGRQLAAGLLLLLLLVAPARAQDQALLIDGSSSMRPYYQRGLIVDLSRMINDALSENAPTQLAVFSDGVQPLSTVEQLTGLKLGAWTYLDRALDYAMQKKYRVVWMITDNMESQSSDPEAANTEIFYRKLRSAQVKKVVIFPLVQTPGSAGLVIYAVQLSQSDDNLFEDELKRFSDSVKGVYRTEPLRMKPLDQDTVEINFVRGNLQPKDGRVAVYKEGQNITEKVELRFKSRFKHLQIVDAQIEVPLSEAKFAAGSLLQPEKREIKITPEKVSALDPQGETEQVYEASIDLGKVKLKRDPASLWKAAWGKTNEEVELPLSFVIQVPQENFRFKESVLQTYGAKTPQAAKETGKIYGLERLPQLMGEPNTPITTQLPLRFRVQYPWWPALIWIGLLLLAAAIVILFIIFATKLGRGALSRSGQWAVSAQTIHGAPLKCELEQRRVVVQGDHVGEINKSSFIPAQGVKVDGAAESVRLADSLRLQIERKGKQTVLLFKKAADKEQAETNSSHTPRKR